METEMKFNLGDKVKCPLMGVSGRVMKYCKHIYSQDRVLIQPAYDTTQMKMPAGHYIDITGLIKEEDSPLEALPKWTEGKFTLGDTVKDGLSGTEGIVVQRALCHNGCYRLSISFNAKKGEQAPSGMWIEEKGAKLVKSINENKEVKKADRTTGSIMETVEHE